MTRGPARRSISTVYEESVDGARPIGELLRRYLPGRAALFGAAVVVAAAWRASKLVPPYLLGITIDAFFAAERDPLSVAFVPDAWIPATTRGQFAFVMGLFLAVALGTRLLEGVQVLSWRRFQQSVLHDLRTDAYDAAQRLDVAFFESERTGDVMSVLNNDVNQLEAFLTNGLRTLVQLTAFFVGLLAIMLALHWQLTLVALAFVPLTLGLARVYQRAIEPRYDARREAVGALNGRIQNSVAGIETVKASAAEGYERSRLETRSRAYWRADWNAAKVTSLFDPARGFLTNAAMIAIMVVGGWWALFDPPFGIGNSLSAGTFVTFYFYSSMFVAQSSRIGDVVDTYVDAKASAKRVFGLVHHPSAVAESADATPLESASGRIEFRDVTFAYPGADEPAVRNVTFSVRPDEFVGIVGPTGAGKSTILKLLLRFYDPDRGTISVGGTDVADATIESLRGSIGYVSQDPFLFDGTIRENIAYGDPGADDDAIVAAAERANAHEFVTELPEGYDTEVGERGVKLSGGQRQRIAVARAVLEDPDVLLLDEATSHVDARTELLVRESLAELAADRTAIAVAHRLSTVRRADRILVFDDGTVAESGTHEELLAEGGLYATLWRIHVGETGAIRERPGGRSPPADRS